MAVDPSDDVLADFLADEPDGPVVMLNLLRFADGGRPRYQQYAKAFGETVAPRYGVEVVYAGDGSAALVAEAGQQWDAVLLVRYPTRHAFGRMLADPEYQQIAHLRRNALSEAVLQPTRPWGRHRPGAGRS
ncbi:DUF1330 domain-containing protein [Micromonospora sp. Llam7]|uniref:DUF1330 domain-containing protein n=1 Tax=Micromonospora tarapacensis TaxID=2835305 RepID=UPI001C834895|nr:DUF1330 domain-containing protein [Micromonospora tarapacensis]MBX7267623.1 DUF1330 domain-containing protein [Micromonospora tarapacensis]